MDFLQGQSLEATVAIAVAVAAGGVFLLLRSKKSKGMAEHICPHILVLR